MGAGREYPALWPEGHAAAAAVLTICAPGSPRARSIRAACIPAISAPALGVPFHGRAHNALDDARSVALAHGGDGGARRLVAPWRREPVRSRPADRVAGLAAASRRRAFPRDVSGLPANGPGSFHRHLFLLKAGEVSRWHRVDAAEVWHFYRGAPLELKIGRGRHVLGPDIENGASRRKSWCRPAHGRWREAWAITRWWAAPWRRDLNFPGFEMAPEGSSLELTGS